MKRLSCFCFFPNRDGAAGGRSGAVAVHNNARARSSPVPQAQGPQSGSYPRRVNPDFEENSRLRCGKLSAADETGIPSHKEGVNVPVYGTRQTRQPVGQPVLRHCYCPLRIRVWPLKQAQLPLSSMARQDAAQCLCRVNVHTSMAQITWGVNLVACLT